MPFRTILSRLALALLCGPALSLVLFGASVGLATAQLGHVPGPTDRDVDALGYGGLTHPAVWL